MTRVLWGVERQLVDLLCAVDGHQWGAWSTWRADRGYQWVGEGDGQEYRTPDSGGVVRVRQCRRYWVHQDARYP